MSDGYSGLARNLGHIYKITPDGVPSTFASGLNGPLGLAFDSAGNLFVAVLRRQHFKIHAGRSAKHLCLRIESIRMDWPLTARAICLWRIGAAAHL